MNLKRIVCFGVMGILCATMPAQGGRDRARDKTLNIKTAFPQGSRSSMTSHLTRTEKMRRAEIQRRRGTTDDVLLAHLKDEDMEIVSALCPENDATSYKRSSSMEACNGDFDLENESPFIRASPHFFPVSGQERRQAGNPQSRIIGGLSPLDFPSGMAED